MRYNAKNGTLKIGTTTMDYIRFGTGKQILIMLPGSGLKMYPQWGHGLYEKAGDFNRTIMNFLKQS